MPEQIFKFVIGDTYAQASKCRLDHFVQEQHDIALSRSQVRKLIIEAAITVNGRPVKAGYSVKASDVVTVTLPEPRPSELVPEALPLDVLYEDEQLLVVNKPVGISIRDRTPVTLVTGWGAGIGFD